MFFVWYFSITQIRFVSKKKKFSQSVQNLDQGKLNLSNEIKTLLKCHYVWNCISQFTWHQCRLCPEHANIKTLKRLSRWSEGSERGQQRGRRRRRRDEKEERKLKDLFWSSVFLLQLMEDNRKRDTLKKIMQFLRTDCTVKHDVGKNCFLMHHNYCLNLQGTRVHNKCMIDFTIIC